MKYKERIKRLQQFIESCSCEAILVENQVDLFYLTGLQLSAGNLLVTVNGATLYVDMRYLEFCQKHSPVTVERQDALKKSKTLAFDSAHTSYLRFKELEELHTKLIPLNNPIQSLRMIKDQEELELLRKAAKLGYKGYEYVSSLLKEDISEEELAQELEIFWLRKGSLGLAFEPIIAFGSNSSMPHYRAGQARLKRGTSVLIDIGVNLDHYHSDMTRIVFFGEPLPVIREIYTIVQKAQQAALDLCKPGTLIGTLDSVARNFIADAGYGEYFTHSLGHGIGLEIHEAPFLRNKPPYQHMALMEGMVITIEPGIYLPNVGGVRIEDTVAITSNGYENLTLIN